MRGRAATWRVKLSIFSAAMGLRLKGMALDPTCLGPKGSLHSPKGGRLEDAQVEGELVEAGAQPGEGVDDEPVLLAGVGLGGGFEGGQIQLRHDAFFELAWGELAVVKEAGRSWRWYRPRL